MNCNIANFFNNTKKYLEAEMKLIYITHLKKNAYLNWIIISLTPILKIEDYPLSNFNSLLTVHLNIFNS